MLSIRLQEPGVYAACDGEEVLGLCRFEAREAVTVVRALEMRAPEDREMLDGLLRAVLFHGLRLGRPSYRLEEGAAAPCREALRALGIAESGEVESLPRNCRED
jgi:hypothetical protein